MPKISKLKNNLRKLERENEVPIKQITKLAKLVSDRILNRPEERFISEQDLRTAIVAIQKNEVAYKFFKYRVKKFIVSTPTRMRVGLPQSARNKIRNLFLRRIIHSTFIKVRLFKDRPIYATVVEPWLRLHLFGKDVPTPSVVAITARNFVQDLGKKTLWQVIKKGSIKTVFEFGRLALKKTFIGAALSSVALELAVFTAIRFYIQKSLDEIISTRAPGGLHLEYLFGSLKQQSVAQTQNRQIARNIINKKSKLAKQDNLKLSSLLANLNQKEREIVLSLFELNDMQHGFVLSRKVSFGHLKNPKLIAGTELAHLSSITAHKLLTNANLKNIIFTQGFESSAARALRLLIALDEHDFDYKKAIPQAGLPLYSIFGEKPKHAVKLKANKKKAGEQVFLHN